MKKVRLYIGTRPNLIKTIPLYPKLRERMDVDVVDTGQHWDEIMMGHGQDIPIRGLDLKTSRREEIREAIISDIEKYPDFHYGMVIGDVNSTLGAAWALKTVGKPFAHIEAGMRSDDWRMEEEYNRYVTDHLADINFVTERQALRNLPRHSFNYHVGNLMIDQLIKQFFDGFSVPFEGDYILATIHRRENMGIALKDLLKALERNTTRWDKIYVVMHPHLRKLYGNHLPAHITPIDPLAHKDFIGAIYGAKVFITDSGGAATEAFAMGVPTIVYRNVFEHKVCQGYFFEVSPNAVQVVNLAEAMAAGQPSRGIRKYSYWSDGLAGERIAEKMEYHLQIMGT